MCDRDVSKATATGLSLASQRDGYELIGAPPLAPRDPEDTGQEPPSPGCPYHAVESHSQTAIRVQKEVFKTFISIFISFFLIVFANVL